VVDRRSTTDATRSEPFVKALARTATERAKFTAAPVVVEGCPVVVVGRRHADTKETPK
jgi:hypothetical protein